MSGWQRRMLVGGLLAALVSLGGCGPEPPPEIVPDPALANKPFPKVIAAPSKPVRSTTIPVGGAGR